MSDSNYREADNFVRDLTQCIDEMKKDPSLNKIGGAAMYGIQAKVPDSTVL